MRFLYTTLIALFLFNSSQAQLVVNEFSQGNSGNREYIELVVKGTRTCTDSVADLRGWIVDDQNGWYGGTGTGIAAGHLRFSNVANWQAVPYGSIILLYNASDKNTSITLADDPTDANNDHVYVVPVATTSTVVESNNSSPAAPSSPTYVYPTTPYATANNDWTSRIGLANGGDAVITVAPTALGTPYHSVVFGLTVGAGFMTPNVLLGAVAAQKNAYLTNSSYTAVASWTVGNAGTGDETPGAPNTTANAAWITSMLTPATPITGTASASICTGQTYTFGSSTYSTTGTYTAIFPAANGCDSTVTLSLTVNPLPAAPGVIATITYCQNQLSVPLTATGTNLKWYTQPTGGTGTTVAPTPATTTPGSTTWYVSQTTGGCESPRAAITVNITATPATPTVTTPVNYCQNATATALTATGTNLLWYTQATGGTGTNAAPTPSTASAGTITWYVSQTVSGCESNRAAIVVNVTAQPAAPAVTTPVTFCQNSTATALTATGANLLWYVAPSGGTGANTAPLPTTTTVGSTTWYVSQTVNGCESPRAAITVTIIAQPAAPTVATPVFYCQNQTATALTATGTALLWYTTATGGTGTNVAPTPVTTTVGSTTWYVSQTVGGCESPRAALTVTVGSQPAAPAVTSPVNYCQNAMATPLTASGSGLLWYTTATGGTGTNVAPTPPTTTAGSTTWYVSQASGSCEGPRSAITVVVTAQPAAPTVTAAITYCQTAAATALTATGSNLLWYTTPTGGTGTTIAPVPSTTTAGTTTWYVSQTVNGCTSNRAAITVTVNAKPVAPNTVIEVYCQFDTPTPVTATGSNLLWYTTATGGVGSNIAPTPFTLNPGVTNYYVSQTVNGCESDRVMKSVEVKAKPAAPVVSTPINYCQNQPAATLSATGANLLWYIAANGGTGTNVAPTPVTTTAGIFTWYVSQTVNGCESNRTALTVNVIAKPAAPVPTPATVTYCQGLPAVALAATGSNLLWYTTATGGVGTNTAPTPGTAAAGTTSWYVSQTVNGCESDRAQITVNVILKPAAPVVANVSYCQGQPAVALTASGSNLLWYTAATGGTGTTVAPTPATAAPGVFTWYVSQTVSCESDRSPITVTVISASQLPVVTSPVMICATTAANISLATYATGVNLLWYTAPVGGAGNTVAPTINTGTQGTYTYYVSQTAGSCESGRAQLVITVGSKPGLPTVVTPVTYCQNAVATPLGATGSNLRWYATATGGTGSTTVTVPSTATAGTISYYVSQTVNGCESDRAAIVVTVVPTPATPVANTSYNYCQFEIAGALTANGTGIKWYNTPTGGTPLAVVPTVNTNVPGTFTYYVTQTVNGCESPRLPVTVTVKPKPAPPTVQTPIRYCQYATPQQLTALGQNLKWYFTPSGGQGTSFVPTPNTGYEDTLNYWVTQTVNGCESDRTLIQVMIYQKPNGIILTDKPFVCQYDTVMFYYFGNARPDADVDWKVTFKKATLVKQQGRDTIFVRFDSAGIVPIRMQVNYHTCVSDEFILNVNVRPVPVLQIAAKPEVCLDETSVISLDYATPGITSYLWDFDGGTVLYGNAAGGPYGIRWPMPGTYVVSVKATANECTSLPYTDTIKVHELPSGAIAGFRPNQNICSGDSITLTAQEKQNGKNIYLWEPKLYFNDEKGADSTLDEAVAVVKTRSYIYLTVRNEYGCTGKDSALIDAKPCCEVYFPDAFTPNNDGRNDLFRVITPGHHKISMFRIQNRWGQTVFETADETRGWDGTMNGVPQEMGTYFYYVKYRCVTKEYFEKKGEVTLIR